MADEPRVVDPAGANQAAAPKIAGMSTLKGLILYGATLTFAGLYGYFIYRIFAAPLGHPPAFDSALVTAAAGLAGVLGSAFALEIGTPTDERATNPSLKKAIEAATEGEGTASSRSLAQVRRVLSLDPSDTKAASWPKTFGIWSYAIVATAVALTYVLNETETPETIRALAVAFGGYVIALINTAYGLATK